MFVEGDEIYLCNEKYLRLGAPEVNFVLTYLLEQ